MLASLITLVNSFKAYAIAGLGLLALILIVFRTSRTSALQSRALVDLVQSASQWSASSLQDSNVLLSLMHANYAMAYLNVARLLSSDSEIESTASVRLDELLNEFKASQSSAIGRLTSTCPAAMPPGLSAVHTGWIVK